MAIPAWHLAIRWPRNGTSAVPTLLVVGAILLGSMGAAIAADGTSVKGANDVIFVSGGIGESEQAQLAARESEFNLKLVFSLVEGNYVADVGVSVRDSRGAIVAEHVAEGPIFMARLPAGRYRLAATYGGKTLVRDVSVNASRLRTEYLRWPADPANDLPVSRWLDKD